MLGDGTHSNGAIQGAAPEARLYFQAIETEATISGTTDGYLLGIPNNLYDLFEPAYDNGSRVHTNSWGSAVNGQYTTSSAQADASAHILWDMAILFAAGNEGTDGNSDGEVDLDSMSSPARQRTSSRSGQRKTTAPPSPPRGEVGGQETTRTNPVKDDRHADNIDGMAAFSSRGPTDDSASNRTSLHRARGS